MSISLRYLILGGLLVTLFARFNSPRYDFSGQRPRAWTAPDREGWISRAAGELSDRLKEEQRKKDLEDSANDPYGYDQAWDDMGTIFQQQVANTYFDLAKASWVLYWREMAEWAAASDPSIEASVQSLTVFFAGTEGNIDGKFTRVHVDIVVESIEPLLFDDQLVHDLRVWRNEAKAAAGAL